jgi:ribosomal protein L22
MTPDAPKDPKDEAEVTEETQETTEAAAEEKPKPKRTRAKKKAEEPTAEAAATEAETDAEEKPKPRRTRAKKDEARKEEPTAEETADESAAEEEPQAEEEPTAEEAAEEPKAEKKPRAKKAEKAEEPAPTRKRDRRRQPEPGVLVRAQAKYVRTSARKARLVCDHIRGKDVVEARAILAFTPRSAAKPWLKLLESAVANAEHNHELVGEELRIESVHADEGPTLKRFRPRAMGRATRIRKRTSHLTITLTPKEL